MATVYLGLGTNMGDRAANLAAALDGIAALPGTRLMRRAGIYETAPVGGPAGQDDYLNTVCEAETTLSPGDMIAETQRIERELGRDRGPGAVRWGPRVIDIDILLWDDVTCRMSSPGGIELELPHPRMAERAFVLLPLAELAPELVHPGTGATIRELVKRIDTNDEGIRRLSL